MEKNTEELTNTEITGSGGLALSASLPRMLSVEKGGWPYGQSVQSLSRVRLFVTPWTAAHWASLSIINSRSLLKLMFIKSVMPSSHLILCCPLFFLPLIPSQHQGLFQRVSSSHQVAKVLEFQLQHQSFQ